MQLTDELAQKILPDCEGAEDLRTKLQAAAGAVIIQRTAVAVNNKLTLAVGELIDVEVPESMVRELGTQEYQAQLLEMQTRVRFLVSTLLENALRFGAEILGRSSVI